MMGLIVGLGCLAGREGRSSSPSSQKGACIVHRRASGEAPTHAALQLLGDFQGKQREVTSELYTLQEVGSC